MPETATLSEQVRSLRQAFDAAFAAPALAGAEELVHLLVVRAGAAPRAVRIVDLLKVETCPALVALPQQHPAFLGLGAVRGRATAVYGLARLLGLPEAAAGHRWLLLGQSRIAVAVTAILGSLQVRPVDLAQTPAGSTGPPLVAFGGSHCPVIDLPTLLHPLGAATARRPSSLE